MIIPDLKGRGIAFRSPTEQMDTITLHGELLSALDQKMREQTFKRDL